ncbi:probable receptor-like protein kinase At2g21480 isoform X1 [Argentina anserina]|uniref:probable receptor-like protein kinase At2g21480 isoform X1 n=1 Tax=Argentina anserina TaxID=57926 RepID=UPI0021766D0A|nr:probable receptor-like protein kinase At2g21480 isoform X1 [Potentilla anserina]
MEIERTPNKRKMKYLFLSSLPSLSLSCRYMMAILLVFFYALLYNPTIVMSDPSSPTTFTPQDNFLIACGSKDPPKLPDGRVFKTDSQANQHLKANDDNKVSDDKADVPSPLYSNARIFTNEATYTFHMGRPGWHWVRLYFYPIQNSVSDLQKTTFNVVTEKYTLLHNFNFNEASNNNTHKAILKEYLLNVTEQIFSIKFSPQKNSAAFINAIEVVSAPDYLIGDTANNLQPMSQLGGLSNFGYETMYRVNMGGPLVTSVNDTLGRMWLPDEAYIKSKNMAKTAKVESKTIKYPQGLTPQIAPPTVYATAAEMADAGVGNQKFNVTWTFQAENAYGYLIRLHFCDIVSKSLGTLFFNVYINGYVAISELDLSQTVNGLAIPFYKDIVVNSSLVNDMVTIQIGPSKLQNGVQDAILNGLEVMKISNSVNSLDGEFGVDGKEANDSSGGGVHKGAVAAVGFGLMFGAFIGLGAMVYKWKKRPQDWQKRNSFSSWLLPVHAGDNSFMSSKNSVGKSMYSGTMGLGRFFSFAELQEATNNFDSSKIIGVGGFGNVYLGVIDDGTSVAVKRGNPQSEQGITEFQTEIQMLSKLRHRHLVSLIGYCDENQEMILVYEYMSNGPFRDHLYGKDLPPLSWKQRLEICIGAARGLHYLHTGTAQGIIHRDVKTTNILLDDQFTAKVADFGLSKDAPMGQNHVSTAVKGSFGYLDPEYFRRQQLTDKSDVYSFGVVMLEALCARPAINPALPREQVNLADWGMQWKRKGLLEKIVDPLLIGTINPESMKKFGEAAEKCLLEHGVDRPTMGDVLWNLEYALQLQEAFTEAKGEEDNTNSNPSADVAPASSADVVAASTAAAPRPASILEEEKALPTEQIINDQSGTAMFAQFSNLNGR